jgi:cysteine desulfurase
METNAARMKKTRDDLYRGLKNGWPGIRRNGHAEKVLPNTLSVSFEGLDANRILEEIGLHVAASAGAACHSDIVEISHVLAAMGLTESRARGALRFSTGKNTTDDEIVLAVREVLAAVEKLAEEKEASGK